MSQILHISTLESLVDGLTLDGCHRVEGHSLDQLVHQNRVDQLPRPKFLEFGGYGFLHVESIGAVIFFPRSFADLRSRLTMLFLSVSPGQR